MHHVYTLVIVTFILFFIEAIVHFNIGLKGGQKKFLNPKKTHTKVKFFGGFLHIPDIDELSSIVAVLILFAGLNVYIADYFMTQPIN